eukprot:1346640-Amorphochlora_amoeboformis.AAC.1
MLVIFRIRTVHSIAQIFPGHTAIVVNNAAGCEDSFERRAMQLIALKRRALQPVAPTAVESNARAAADVSARDRNDGGVSRRWVESGEIWGFRG